MLIESKNYSPLDIIRLTFRCAPIDTIIIAISKILDGIVPNLRILVTAWFIDTSILVVKSNSQFKKVIPSMIVLTLLIAYSWVSEKLINFIQVKMEIKLRETLRICILEKRANLEYKHIENSESWDLISRISMEPEINLKDGYMNFLSLASMIINVVGFVIILISEVWWAALIVLSISIPLMYISIKAGKATYNADRESVKYLRKYKYFSEVLTERDGNEERALFRFTKNMNKKWEEYYDSGRKLVLKVDGKWFVLTSLGGIITSLIIILIIAILVKPLIAKTITIGIFMSLINASISLISLVSWQLTFTVSKFTKHLEFMKDLEKFSNLTEEQGATDYPLETPITFNKLEFKNVRFKYPGTKNYVLDGMSFIIEKGKHYAFVGSNGAGKTTVTKLITGLYNEYEGQILINGQDIKKYSQSYIKALCSVVYQDFAKYSISFKDNISLGRVNGLNSNKNDELIMEAIDIMELKDVVDKLPNGIDSYLGKIKTNGVDVSGGEWQRIAMARAIVNPSPLKILDEPTAALDPISESNIYKKFEDISNEGTTIFISHRLGSTKLADEIFVLGEGKILESGSHNDLIRKNGIYATMYESQKGWYI